MAYAARNLLTLDPLANGKWKLHGRVLGKRIRWVSDNVRELEVEKAKLEQQVDAAANIAQQTNVHRTWLSVDQIRDAEAATQRAAGRTLLECVFAAERVLPTTATIACTEALKQWLAALAERRRFARTVEKNRLRVEAFLKITSAENVTDITPAMVERYVYAKGAASYTQTTNGQVVRAWLNFCVKRRWLRVSPFEVDMADLSATAKPAEAARILTPAQCTKLYQAAASVRGGYLLPYTILATWCFMRHAEALRVRSSDLKLDGKTPLVICEPRKRGTVSHRTVTVPENVLAVMKHAQATGALDHGVRFSRSTWDSVREAAGLLSRAKAKNGRRAHLESEWQENLLRHTGISYFYQRTGDIKETCRQAGNSDDTAFRHYLNLPAEGASENFYSVSE